MKQYCAECGKKMTQLDNGSYLRCCSGLGYWASVKPADGYRLTQHGKYYLYMNTGLWPKGKRAERPK